MLPYFSDVFGNPSSAHAFGRRAEQAVEDARERIASLLHCKPNEVIFTSGGSESNNLALRGALMRARVEGKPLRFVTSPIEHSAVSRTAEQLSRVMGCDWAQSLVDAYGVVHPAALEATLGEPTRLVSVIYANNEIGTVQDIAALASVAREHGALFHTDAVQAVGQCVLDVQALGVDGLSLSAHKFYAPKGVGLLYWREGADALMPAQTGGSHERGRRAGTLNTAAIVGMAVALELAIVERETRIARYTALRDMLIEGVLERVPSAELAGHPTQRLASHASFTFDGLDGNQLVMHMDMRGVAVSSASACKTGNPEPSEVLLALGHSPEKARSGLRLSIGLHTTEHDITRAIEAVKASVEALFRLKKVLAK
jgi:cysteine desulfurase